MTPGREKALTEALTNCVAALDTEHEMHMSRIPEPQRYPITAIHAYSEAKAALRAQETGEIVPCKPGLDKKPCRFCGGTE
jgi:hypothetical protein